MLSNLSSVWDVISIPVTSNLSHVSNLHVVENFDIVRRGNAFKVYGSGYVISDNYVEHGADKCSVVRPQPLPA